MNIKASTLFALAAIWGCMILAVAQEPGAAWGLIFAFFASLAIAPRFWRGLGLSKLIGIVAIWLGTAAGVASDSDATWVTVFAALGTFAVSTGMMRRDATILGMGIAMAWLVVGTVTARDAGAAWTCVFAFLTTAILANSRGDLARGGSAMLWWAFAGALMLIADGWYFLVIPAFLLSATSIGFADFRWPQGIDWDFFDRDEDDEDHTPRVANPPQSP